MGDVQQWKDKYLRARNELKHLKADWDKERKALQRAVAKVVVAATGGDERVDQLLEDVRVNARGSASKDIYTLNKHIDALEHALLGVGERQQAKNLELTQLVQRHAQKLRAQIRDEQVCERIGVLEASVAKAVKSRSEPQLVSWLKILSDLPITMGVETQATQIESDLEANQGGSSQVKATTGILQKLFKPLDKVGAAELPTSIVEPVNQAELQKKQEIAEIAHTCTEICHALYAFLMDLDPPEALQKSAEPLRARLEKNISVEEIPPAIKTISDIVIGTLQFQGEDFEAFLKNTEKGLGHLNQTLVETGESRKTIGKQTGNDILAQVQDLSTVVEQAEELELLKKEVRKNINGIKAQLAGYQRNHVLQESSLMSQLQTLSNKVANMEAESKIAEQALERQITKTYTDALTQIPNRAAYEHKINDEYQRWSRYKHPLSLIICDLDEFKKINDTYGHLAGDKVLKVIANTLKQHFRKTDFVARFGGEEFVIILPEAKLEQAVISAEKVRGLIANLDFKFRDEEVRVSASFGVAAFNHETDQIETVFERADRALYNAKQKGRNKVVRTSN